MKTGKTITFEEYEPLLIVQHRDGRTAPFKMTPFQRAYQDLQWNLLFNPRPSDPTPAATAASV